MNKQSYFTNSQSDGLKPEKQTQGTIVVSPTEENNYHPCFGNVNAKPQQSTEIDLATAIVKMLENLGVNNAFGILGGAIAPLASKLQSSSIRVIHCRHETGAAFAAIESYFASNLPAVIFTTTGPGITNALTGLFAARWEGAKVIFLSASTSAPQRGRWAFQETSSHTMPSEILSQSGSLYHYAATLECSEQLPQIGRQLALGLARPGGFVAHLSVPTTIQTIPFEASLPLGSFQYAVPSASEEVIAKSIQLLSEAPFAIWVGFGARNAASEIRQLAANTSAGVMCSPRGKGIFPENHPQFIGVTGFGGHEEVLEYMRKQPPLRILVLGTRLGEFTSFWNPLMVPQKGFIHVDLNPEIPGVAYPNVETFPIQSDIGEFVKALLKYFPQRPHHLTTKALPSFERKATETRVDGSVRPSVLMETIQKVIVEGSNAVVMTEAGNSFAWGTNALHFNQPNRYRVSTGFGSMGHAATGVMGAALAHNGKAVAILGDGAMLMNCEINTCVNYQIPAVWIVLNDGGYNMVNQGMAMQGLLVKEAEIPQADFVMIARGMGADGIRVFEESELESALEKALASSVPFVVDVVIDPTQPAPIGGRVKSLIAQSAQ
ncbi:MAG: thiamine pyrophosphate-binding protein [Hydrococcus sp. Prado102]|jgi:acetolactate synthase-1/2/3 large subunit|nr:thiamine pyrophosphate-binding protein [Hydrococcus sp. Prado102]